MTARQLPFRIDEQDENGFLRLVLIGELDLAVAPALEDRLGELRERRRHVRLDLSELEFIDSTGLHVLIDAINHARSDGWQLEIGHDVTPQVMRVLELTKVDRFISGADGNGR